MKEEVTSASLLKLLHYDPNFKLPPGPWDLEPNYRVERLDNNIIGVILRRLSGYLCGAIVVLPTHRLFKHTSGECWCYLPRTKEVFPSIRAALDPVAHGGISCSLPLPKMHVFGFDCGHEGDYFVNCFYTPAVYRNFDYVEKHVYAMRDRLNSLEILQSKRKQLSRIYASLAARHGTMWPARAVKRAMSSLIVPPLRRG